MKNIIYKIVLKNNKYQNQEESNKDYDNTELIVKITKVVILLFYISLAIMYWFAFLQII